MDTPNALNSAETASMSNGDGAYTYLGTGSARCSVEATDGSGSHADVSSGHRDMPSVEIGMDTAVNAPESAAREAAKLTYCGCKTALRQLKWLRNLHEP